MNLEGNEGLIERLQSEFDYHIKSAKSHLETARDLAEHITKLRSLEPQPDVPVGIYAL